MGWTEVVLFALRDKTTTYRLDWSKSVFKKPPCDVYIRLLARAVKMEPMHCGMRVSQVVVNQMAAMLKKGRSKQEIAKTVEEMKVASKNARFMRQMESWRKQNFVGFCPDIKGARCVFFLCVSFHKE
jgi:hypothetical protein